MDFFTQFKAIVDGPKLYTLGGLIIVDFLLG